MRIARMAVIACIGWLLTGCAPDLYLTESEVAAFAANLKTAQRANTLFADLDGEVFDIRLAPAPGGGFTVQSSNTLAMLREMQRLRFIADTWHQIRLERLASQLDRQLANWLREQTLMLERQSGSRIEFTRIDRVTLGIVEPPTFIRHRVANHPHRTHRIVRGSWPDGA